MSCMQHTRLPCPSLSPWVCSNSCPLSQWCHPIISSSVFPFFSCSQSFCPASGSFPVSQIFVSGGQSIEASASSSVLPMNIWGWFPLGLTGLISLLSKGLSRVFCSTTVQKYQFLAAHPSLWSSSNICTWLLEKTWLWLYGHLSIRSQAKTSNNKSLKIARKGNKILRSQFHKGYSIISKF